MGWRLPSSSYSAKVMQSKDLALHVDIVDSALKESLETAGSMHYNESETTLSCLLVPYSTFCLNFS